MSTSTGYLYIVYGDKRYHREAEISARSLKSYKRDSHDIAIITDDITKVDLNSKIWDQVLPYPELVVDKKHAEFVDGKFEFKVDAMVHSPFEETLFVDTDTYFLGPVDGLFALLQWYDMALLPKTGEGNIKRPHEPHETIEGHTPYNTGIILFRRNQKTTSVFQRWARYYRDQRSTQRSRNDQAYFLIALSQVDNLKVHALPSNYNARFNGFLGLTGKVKVLHAAGMKGLSADGYRVIGNEINKTNVNRGWNPKTKKISIR